MRVGSILVFESFLLRKSLTKEMKGLSFLSRKKMREAKNSNKKSFETGTLQIVKRLRFR